VKAAILAMQSVIVGAGKCLGMPGSTDAIPGLLGSGVRYVYTHLPRIVGAGAAGFLKAARG
jgi:hypothetical protein